jgi:uncharacterized membrane protein
MIRKLLSAQKDERNQRRDKRNYEIQRIETFSDGVFAFAVTLLIVSLEVPKSFEELLVTMRGFFAFGLSFSILVMIWNEQHRFFRRFGLDDFFTTFLNCTLLFIVLFYVYPLKFLFTMLFSASIYGVNKGPIQMTQHQVPELMMIYAIGFMAIYALFFLMYWHACRKSKELELTASEKFDCRSTMYKELIMVIIAVCSLITAFLLKDEYAGLAGWIYMLLAPAITIYFSIRNKIRKKLFPLAPKSI